MSLTCFYSGDNGDKTQRNVTQNDGKRKDEYFSTILYIGALDSKMAWHDIMLKSVLHDSKRFINGEYNRSMHFKLNGSNTPGPFFSSCSYPEQYAVRRSVHTWLLIDTTPAAARF